MPRWNLPVTFTDEEALAAMGLPQAMLDEMRGMICATRQAARPCALVEEFEATAQGQEEVLLGDVLFRGRIPSVNLSQSGRGVAYVCTCGRELHELSQAIADPMERYFQDALNEMVLHRAAEALRERAGREFSMEPLYVMNPGSLAGWPLTEQAPLFALLGDVTGRIGVELTDSCLMVPAKTVSGIFFTSKEEYVNCAFCDMAKCSGRRAPYDPELYQSRFGGAHA